MRFLQANIMNLGLAGMLAVLNMLLSIIEARVLGPAGVGNYQVFISTQTIIGTVCAFGMGNAGIYFIRSNQTTARDFVSTTMKAELALSLVVVVTLFLVVFFNEGYFGHIPVWILLIFSSGASTLLVRTAMAPVLLSRFEIYKSQGVGLATTSLSILLIGIVYWTVGHIEVKWLLLITSSCGIVGALVLVCFLWKDIDFGIPFCFRKFWGWLKYGVQFSLSNVAYLFILNVPIYALTFLLPEGMQAVGFYTRAVAICTIAMFVNKQIGPLLFVKLSSNTDEEKVANTRLMSTFFLVFNGCMIFLIAVLARPIILLLYGEAYLPAVPLVQLLCVSVFFTGITELGANLCSALGKPHLILLSLVSSLVSLLPLIWVCIKLFGVSGAPVAVVLAGGVKALVLIGSLRSHINVGFADFFSVTPDRLRECYRSLMQRLR